MVLGWKRQTFRILQFQKPILFDTSPLCVQRKNVLDRRKNGVPMTPVGFEPTPFRNGALSHRLRPLGQSVHVACGQVILVHVPANGGREVCRLNIKSVFHICAILRRCRFVFLWLFDVSGQAIIGGDCGADPDSLTLRI